MAIKKMMRVRELQMREYYDEDIDDFNTAFSFVVDYEGMRYTVGELFCDGIYSIEEVERYIVCYLMARSEHDDSKLYWQMVDKSQLNEETETIIKIYGKSRTESRKLPKNLELSAFLCTFANER